MDELVEDFKGLPVSEQMIVRAKTRAWIDAFVEPYICTVEAFNREPIEALENGLRIVAGEDAFAIYQQIDLLVAKEKGELARQVYWAGFMAGYTVE